MSSDSFQRFASQLPAIVISASLTAVGSALAIGVTISNRVAELAVQQMATAKQLEAAESRVAQAYAAQVNFNRSSEAADARLNAEMVALRDRMNRLERAVDRQDRSDLTPGTQATNVCTEQWPTGS